MIASEYLYSNRYYLITGSPLIAVFAHEYAAGNTGLEVPFACRESESLLPWTDSAGQDRVEGAASTGQVDGIEAVAAREEGYQHWVDGKNMGHPF